MTKRINKILWNGTEVPQAATRADGLDGLNLGELFIKNDPQEPGIYTRTTDGKVVLLGGGGSGTSELVDWNSIVNKPTKVSYFINDAGYATTSDIDTRIDALVNGAPAAYDTLKEIADVLANNINSIDDILTALGTKVSKDDFNTAIANVNSSISALNTELSGKIDLKLDAVTFNELFEKVQLEDGTWAIKAKLGLFSDGFISAKGANPNGGSSSGGGLITSLYRYADLGKTFSDTNNDTFNAYTINKINADLGSRISVLEGKATNVSFTQSLTSGTQIGSISIDGVSKAIYAPTIPTSDINKGVTAYGWGNHASAGYQPLITSTNKLAYSLISGTPTKLSQFTNDLGLGTFAYKSSLAFADLTNKPTTLGGYGITDAYTKAQVDSALSGYLPLSGGTINGNLTVGNSNGVLGIKNTSSNSLAYLIYQGDTNWRVTDNGWANSYYIIHSGNYTDYTYSKSTIDTKLGSYLPLSGGTISSTGTTPLIINSSNSYSTVRFNCSSGYRTFGIRSDGELFVTDLSGWNNEYLIYHSGNLTANDILFRIKQVDGSGSGLDADTLDGYHVNATNTPYNGIPVVCTDGVMEIGKYIDFHHDNTSNNDYDCRLDIQGNYKNIVHLPTSSGILALLTSNVASATKLQTARTIWGQSFDGTGNVNGSIIIEKTQTSFSDSPIQISANANIGKTGYRILNCHYSNLLDGSSMLLYFGVAESKYNAGYLKYDYRGSSNNLNALSLGFYDADDLMCILASGNVGIGNINPQYKLDVSGVIHSTTGIFSDGYVSAKGQNTSSDMRLKNVLNEVVLGVKDIANAPSVRFAWKNGGGVDVGSSAQYWQKLLPDAVKEREGHLEMQYANIALLSAISIAKNFETHEERIAILEKENKELRNEISMMKGGLRNE